MTKDRFFCWIFHDIGGVKCQVRVAIVSNMQETVA